jgi:hypothetical protein
MAGDAENLNHESDDESFQDHDMNESSESPDDDTDDISTAADILMQCAAMQPPQLQDALQVALQVTLQVALQVALQVTLQFV